MPRKVRTVNFSFDEFISGVTGMRYEDIGVYWVICSLIYSSGGGIPKDDERITRIGKCRPSDVKKSIERILKMPGKLIEHEGKLYQKRVQTELKLAEGRIEAAMAGWNARDAKTGQSGVKVGSKSGQSRGKVGAKSDQTQMSFEENQPLAEKCADGPRDAITITTTTDSKLALVDSSLNPTKNESLKLDRSIKRRATPKKKPTRDDLMEGFDRFYDFFPRHVGRGQAEKAFATARRNGATVEQLCEGARRYANECRAKSTEDHYIAHAATWLNGKRWLDGQKGLNGNGADSKPPPGVDPVAWYAEHRLGEKPEDNEEIGGWNEQ